MKTNLSPSRRNFLRGVGALVALPALQSLLPRRAFADDVAAFPTRLGFVYAPNGVNWREWHIQPPAGAEFGASEFDLSPSLKSLGDIRKELLFFRNLALDQGRAHGDGGGDHPRATASFLTAAHAYKNFGRQVHVNGISVDQLAAQKIGNLTRMPSLELGCERPQPPSMCDAGYSGIYRNSISWRGPHSPVPTEINPRAAFVRLFGDPSQGRSAAGKGRDAMLRQSVIDLILDDAKALSPQLGGTDRVKLEEYLSSVRAVEKQIQAAERIPVKDPPAGTVPPGGAPAEPPEYIRVMLDLVVLAFQTDTTRLCSVMLAMGGSDRSFPWLGVSGGHHSYSHHENKPANLEPLAKIDSFYAGQFGYLVRKLAAIKEGNETLLDHCLLLYGCALCDGNKHSREDLPIILAGRGNGAVTPGRLLNFSGETPLANVYLAMLHAAGVKEERFSDSSGILKGIKS